MDQLLCLMGSRKVHPNPRSKVPNHCGPLVSRTGCVVPQELHSPLVEGGQPMAAAEHSAGDPTALGRWG